MTVYNYTFYGYTVSSEASMTFYAIYSERVPKTCSALILCNTGLPCRRSLLTWLSDELGFSLHAYNSIILCMNASAHATHEVVK